MRGDVLPSSKTIAAKSQILNWIEEDPTVKIIVYSQWIPMLHVLGRICQTEGWTFEKYTGHMSHESRDNAIKNFGDPTKGKRILLASLKCGGLGLNLTMASKVLLLDPWWNSAVRNSHWKGRLCFTNALYIGRTAGFLQSIPNRPAERNANGKVNREGHN